MRLRLLFASLGMLGLARAEQGSTTDDSFEAAMKLKDAKRYPEARVILEKLAATEPKNAVVCHELGLIWKLRNDNAAYEQAVKWLGKAAELKPGNAIYLGDFGGTELQLAGRTLSPAAATKGREAMEKAIALDPNYLDARQGLYDYYRLAPWPYGSGSKAAAQLEEIRKRDPGRAMALSVSAKLNSKDYVGAFAICEKLLALNPDDYTALYQYGRTAGLCGQHLEEGIASLKKCLALTPPSPASPSASFVWFRIGGLQEKLNRPAEARTAYEAALKINPDEKQAADALAKLK